MPEPRTGTAETPLGELPGSVVAALSPHLRAVKRRLNWVVGFALVAFLAAVLFNLVRPAAYEAEGLITVTPRAPEDVTLGAVPVVRATPGYPGRPTATVGAIIHTEQVAKRTAAKLGESDPAGLFDQIEVKPDPNANILIVSAPGSTGQQAADRVNTYMETAISARARELAPLVADERRFARRTLRSLRAPDAAQAELLRARLGELRSIADGTDPTFSVTRTAAVPTGRSGLPLWMLLVAAALAGAAIGAGSAVLARLMAPRPATSEAELLESFPAEILARIPDVGLLSPQGMSAVTNGVQGGYRSLRSRLAFASVQSDGSEVPRGLVVVTSGGRGDGRTSASIGLARAVDGVGGAAAVVNLDLASAGASGALGVAADSQRVDLGNGFTATAAMEGSLVVEPPRPENGSSFDRIIRDGRDLVGELLQTADCVIVDGPPLGEFADLLELARMADHLIVVGRIGHTTDRSLLSLAESLTSASARATGLVVVGSDRIDEYGSGTAYGIAHRASGLRGSLNPGAGHGPVAYGGRSRRRPG